jgi:hypothetical protein
MAEFFKLSDEFLKEHSVGLCHDLIRASYPLAAGSYDKSIGSHNATVAKAFTHVKSRTLANWLYDKDYKSAEALKFRGTSAIINQLYQQKEWLRLEAIFRNPPHSIQPDGKAPVEVADKANLELLYKWKRINKGGKGKGKKAKPPIYIRDKNSIDAVKNNKSIYSRVGLMAGGFLQAAMMLGNKPDRWTTKTNFVWLNNAGKGRAIKSESVNHVEYTIENDYANINNYMQSQLPRAQLNKRYQDLDGLFPLIWEQTVKNTGFQTH